MNTSNDLTQGNVRKTLIKYAIPMILTSIMQSMYSIIDMIIVGRFSGATAVSAINNGSLTMNLLVQIAIGFTVGGNVLIGQYFGSKNLDDVKKSTTTLFTFALLSGLVCTVFVFLFSKNLMVALGSPALEEATLYLKTCSFGITFIFSYNALTAILRAVGNSKKPFHFIACSTTLNVFLDLIFVAVLDLGVLGAGVATVISQFLSFSLALTYVLKNSDSIGFKTFKIDPEKIKLIVKYGFPIALQGTVASISWLGVAFLFNKYGADVSAGNGISNKIKEFSQLFIIAIANASSTMVAQNLGAKQYNRAEQILKECLRLAILTACCAIAIVQIFTPQLVSIFINDEDVAMHAIKNLRIEIIAQIFYAGFYSYNILATGSGNTLFVMANSFLNCIIVRLTLAFLLESQIGLDGIYYACMIAPLSSVPVGYIFYKKNKWRKTIS